MIGLVCGGLEEESALNVLTFSELREIVSELTGQAIESLSARDILAIDSPLQYDAVLLVDSMPPNGDWKLALRARRHLDDQSVKVVGASLAGLRAARDKLETRKRLSDAGVAVPVGGPTTARMRAHAPLVVKPQFGSASIGVTFLDTGNGWSVPQTGKFRSWIWEEFIPGRELTVPVIRHQGKLRSLPPIEIEVLDRPIYDYETKIITEANRLHLPARIEKDLASAVGSVAVKAIEALDLGFVARVDIRLKGSEAYVLDVNAEPALHSDDFVARSLSAVKLSIRDLLSFALEDAGLLRGTAR